MSESDFICEDGVCRPRQDGDDRIDPFKLMTPDLLRDLDLSRREGVTETVQKRPSAAATETADGPPEAVRKYLAGQGSRVAGGDADRKLPDPIKPDQTRPRPGKDILPPPRPSDETDTKKDTVELKTRYEANEVDQALAIAEKHNLPVIARIGFKGCPGCDRMEAEVWKDKLEKELKGKAVFIHCDINEMTPGTRADKLDELARKGGGYPTFALLKAKPGADGKADFDVLAERTGYVPLHVARNFFAKMNQYKWGTDR